jgi:hypothetical protein
MQTRLQKNPHTQLLLLLIFTQNFKIRTSKLAGQNSIPNEKCRLEDSRAMAFFVS